MRKRNNDWVRDYSVRNIPIGNDHHVIPRHHGGSDSPENIVPLTVWEHAQYHKEIYDKGYNDGINYISPGCKRCFKAYKSLMGIHNRWKVERNLYHDKEFDIIGWYEDDVKSEDILRNVDEDIITHNFNNIKDTGCVDVDRELDMESLRFELNDILEELKDREKSVLVEYFGLDGKGCRDISQIGENYGINRERARQIKEKAIRRLRYRCLPENAFGDERTAQRYKRLAKLLEIFSK